MRCFTGVLLALTCCGCGKIYLHDPDFETRMKALRTRWTEVHDANSGVWSTMQDNLTKAEGLEVDALTASAESLRETGAATVHVKTWKMIKADAAGIATSKKGELGALKQAILDQTKLIADIQKGAAEAAANGGGADAELLPAPGLLDGVRTALDDLLVAPANDARASLYLAKAAELLAGAEEKVPKALERFSNNRAAAIVLDLLRKSKDQGLSEALTDASTGLAKPADAKLPASIHEAVKVHMNKDVETVGDLRALLDRKDSQIHEIRLSLIQEGRRTDAELREAKLRSAAELLRLYNLHVQVLTAMIQAADRVEKQIGNAKLALKPDTKVLASFESQRRAYHALTPPPATQPREQENYENKLGELRTPTTGALDILVTYTSLTGSLNRWDHVTANRINVVRHRESIELARISTDAYRRLANLGLDGLVDFAEGGITQEQVANWLHALETIGVGVIAGRVD